MVQYGGALVMQYETVGKPGQTVLLSGCSMKRFVSVVNVHFVSNMYTSHHTVALTTQAQRYQNPPNSNILLHNVGARVSLRLMFLENFQIRIENERQWQNNNHSSMRCHDLLLLIATTSKNFACITHKLVYN